MQQLEGRPQITVITGGTGSVSLVDELLNYPFNVTSITGVIDEGGHSGESRSILGVLPPGDATHQLAIHIRNPIIRQIFTKRWKIEGDNKFNGHRPANDFLSAAESITGSHSAGIKAIEDGFKNYEGRVIPVSDDDVHLRIWFEDGTYVDGEQHIDGLTVDHSPIKDVAFIPNDPKPNPEALEHIANARLIMIPPGTLWGSLLPILKTPGVKDALKYNQAPIAWYCNAVTTPETHGYKSSDFAQRLVDHLGRPIDYGLVNKFEHQLPEKYTEDNQFPVENNLQEGELVRKIIVAPLTHLEYSGNQWIVRHHGARSVEALLNALNGTYYQLANKMRS